MAKDMFLKIDGVHLEAKDKVHGNPLKSLTTFMKLIRWNLSESSHLMPHRSEPTVSGAYPRLWEAPGRIKAPEVSNKAAHLPVPGSILVISADGWITNLNLHDESED
jgi:hypothetical protein